MQQKWKILAIVSFGVFMGSLDLFIVNIAFPDIQRDFDGASISSLSWVLNAYAIVYAALLVPAGRLADRYGRKRFFVGGLLGFVFGSALCGIAPGIETLVGARVIQAVGAAMMIPTSLALMLPAFEQSERATAVAIWAAAGGVAAATGPAVGGLLVEVSWRWIFLVNVPVGLVAIVLATRILRESKDPEATTLPDLGGTALLIAGVAALSLGLVEGESWGWGSPRILGAFAVSIATIAWFFRRCASHESPVLDLDMLKVRSFSMANLTGFFFFAAFSAMLLGMVLFMTEVWGESVLKTGLWLTPGPATAALFSVPSGKLGSKIGQSKVAMAGCLVAAAGLFYFYLSRALEPNYLQSMLPAMLLTGMGVGMVIPTISGAVAASLPPARFATGSAVLSTSRQLGAVVGTAAFVAVLGTVDRADPLKAFDRTYFLMIGFLLCGAAAGWAIGTVYQHTEIAATEDQAHHHLDGDGAIPEAVTSV